MRKWFVLLPVAAFVAGSPCLAGSIPLEVANPGGVAVQGWPLTTGVPFPKGALRSPEQVRLLDATGKEVPLQAVSTGNYPDGSVRWLLLDFQSDVPASGRSLSLEYGEGVRPAPVAAPLKVDVSDASIRVDTGPLRFTVSRKRFNGLESVELGGKQVVAAGHDGGPYFMDEGRTPYRACLDPEPEVSVESAGPLRTVIIARGWYRNAAGARKCRYTVRIHAYAGKPYVRLFHTWLMTEDSRTLRFRDIGFRVPMKAEGCRFGLAPGKSHAATLAPGGEAYLLQYDSDKLRVSPEAPGASGTRAPGWVSARGAGGVCTLAVRDFWQLFPKELGADPGGLTFHMWPAHGAAQPGRKVEDAILQSLWFCHEGEVLDFQVPEAYHTYTGEHTENDYRYLRSAKNANAMGLAKTHELLLAFGAGDESVLDAFREPPACMAAPQWMCDSGVFGPLQPVDPAHFPSYEKLLSENFDAEQRMQEATRDYGMWNYGDGHTSWDMSRGRWMDVYRVWRNTHHGAPRVPWLLYVRSGDPKYLRFGVRNTRHVLDEDFCHWSTPELEALEYPNGKLKGALNDYKGLVHWHSGNRLTDYNSMADFALWYYHMTGDRWGLEVALQWADAVKAKFTKPFGSRSGTGTMSALIDVYQETHDPELRRIIDAFFEHLTTKVQNVDGKAIYSEHVLTYWPQYRGKQMPIGAFPEWENYAPWLERYCELTGDERAKKALVAWADAYLEGFGDACSYFGVGDYVNILAYAYLTTRDPKHLGRGVWEADKAVRSAYSGDDPLLKGLMQTGQTSLAGYMIQRLPTFLKALAVHGKPVEPDPLFRAAAGFQLLFERTRPLVEGTPTKTETVEARVLERTDGEMKITLATSHSYDQRPMVVRVLAPSGKEVARVEESTPKGARDLVVTVPRDGETGVYRVFVSGTGSYGRVASPIVVEPALPVAFPAAGRLLPGAGARYCLFVPQGATEVSVGLTTTNGGVSALLVSPDKKTRVLFDSTADGKPAVVRPAPEQTGKPWELLLSGGQATIALSAQGTALPPLLYQDGYAAEECLALAP